MTSGRLRIAASTSATVIVDGREVALFGGCDYLSLAHHPRVVAALVAGTRTYGVSSSGSRETTGNARAHEELEEALATFLGVEAALVVPDGYLSNLVVMQSLPDPVEALLVDREAHVSLRDAARACRVEAGPGLRAIHEYDDHDPATDARPEDVARALGPRTFVLATDGVFPSQRRVAPLARLLRLVPARGLLVVDDCHGLGVLGTRGRGSTEHAGVRDARLVVTGTLSKAFGVFGGFVAGAREHVARARERSHAYVGSTPIPPALACAASEALRVVDDEPERRARLLAHVERVRAVFRAHGQPVADVPLPVFGFRVAAAARASATAAFAARGLLVPWIEYPDGLGGYFRVALRAGHTDAQVDALVAALEIVLRDAVDGARTEARP